MSGKFKPLHGKLLSIRTAKIKFAIKMAIGLAIAIIGIVAALYVGIWVMLIGGIAEIINTLQHSPINGREVAIGICRVIFCEMAGLIAYVGIVIGSLLDR